MTITWSDPGDSSTAGCQMLRRNPEVHGSQVFETIDDDTGSSGTSYPDAGVAPETRYFYWVKSRKAHGGRAGGGGWTPNRAGPT